MPAAPSDDVAIQVGSTIHRLAGGQPFLLHELIANGSVVTA